MIKLFDVNPLAEAMIYYFRLANGETAGAELTDYCKKYPRHCAELEKTMRPIVEMEKKLNDSLKHDSALVNKHFRRLGSFRENAPFGFNLCSVLMCFPVVDHLEWSPGALFQYLRDCDKRERMYNLCFGLMGECETLFRGSSGESQFAQRIEKLQVSYESKWKIAGAAMMYDSHIKELETLLMPAAEQIWSLRDMYEGVVSGFHSRYIGADAPELIKKHTGQKTESVDIMKVAPSLFGFAGRCAIMESDDGSGPEEGDPPPDSPFMGRAYLGICRYLLSEYPQEAYYALSEKMKTLSDGTRLEILFYLCSHTAYGQQLCDKFGLQRPALSYHVSKLHTAGFVNAELSGGKTYYSADREGIDRFLKGFVEEMGRAR